MGALLVTARNKVRGGWVRHPASRDGRTPGIAWALRAPHVAGARDARARAVTAEPVADGIEQSDPEAAPGGDVRASTCVSRVFDDDVAPDEDGVVARSDFAPGVRPRPGSELPIEPGVVPRLAR